MLLEDQATAAIASATVSLKEVLVFPRITCQNPRMHGLSLEACVEQPSSVIVTQRRGMQAASNPVSCKWFNVRDVHHKLNEMPHNNCWPAVHA